MSFLFDKGKLKPQIIQSFLPNQKLEVTFEQTTAHSVYLLFDDPEILYLIYISYTFIHFFLLLLLLSLLLLLLLSAICRPPSAIGRLFPHFTDTRNERILIGTVQ